MSKELVVKANALNEAAYRLGLAEQRLILMAIVQGREAGINVNEKDEITIHADNYAATFNISKQAAYMALTESAKSLIRRAFTYKFENKKGQLVYAQSTWVQYIEYNESAASVKLIFSTKVVPFITQLEKQFTSYELQQVSNLTSTYAIRLYELLMQWKSIKATPVFELEDFRTKLGVGVDEYVKMNNFKARVLDTAIKQINKHTDITIKVEQHKQGRSISGFSFTFAYKEAPKAPKSEALSKLKDLTGTTKLTDKQIGYYAKLLVKSPWAAQAKVLLGVNSFDAVRVISEYIKEPANFDKVKPYIDKQIEKEKADKAK